MQKFEKSIPNRFLFSQNQLHKLDGLIDSSFIEKSFHLLNRYMDIENPISLKNLHFLLFEQLETENQNKPNPKCDHLSNLIAKKWIKTGLMRECNSNLENLMLPNKLYVNRELDFLCDFLVCLFKDPRVILNDARIVLTFFKSLIQTILKLKNQNHFILENSRKKINFVQKQKNAIKLFSKTLVKTISGDLEEIKRSSNYLLSDILKSQKCIDKNLKKVKRDFSKFGSMLLKRSFEEREQIMQKLFFKKKRLTKLHSALEMENNYSNDATLKDPNKRNFGKTPTYPKEKEIEVYQIHKSSSKLKDSLYKYEQKLPKHQIRETKETTLKNLKENLLNNQSEKKTPVNSKTHSITLNKEQGDIVKSVFSKNQLPYYQWNSYKPLFFWDGYSNLKIVSKEISTHIAKLFKGFRAPSEAIIKSIQIKAFTKKKRKPNLLILIMHVNPRYEELINKAWKYGSPSDYFKFKIDLKQAPKIKCWYRFLNERETREILTFKNCPGRFNFSQAFYDIKSKSLSCQKINQMCQEQVQTNLRSPVK